MTESPFPPSPDHASSAHPERDEGEKRVPEEKKTETTVFSLPEKEETPAPKEEETLLIEQDGDFFWILQRILWGILKTGFVLGAIAFLIWLVWRPEKTEEETTAEPEEVTKEVPLKLAQETPQAKETEKPTRKTEAMPMAGVHKGAVTAAEWAEWMEEVEIFEQGHPLVYALDWLKRVASFFQVPTEDLIRGETREERQVRVDAVLSQMWQLIEDSYRLRLSLQKEISSLAIAVSDAQSVSAQAGKLYLDSLKNFNALSAQAALDQNIEAQKAIMENKSNLEARKLVLNHMDQYDKFLRNMYQNIRANRAALIEDIKVVFFPDDPFHQILTPAEWQGMQGK